MYYINIYTFLETPEKDWNKMHESAKKIHQNRHFSTKGGLTFKKQFRNTILVVLRKEFMSICIFSGHQYFRMFCF